MENLLLISDAAKEVQVESHVLRYWEDELHLPIHRNELGHRYYTREDVERFKQIKGMKERGLQLKAIKMILKDGKIDVMMPEEEKEALRQQEEACEKQGQESGQTDLVASQDPGTLSAQKEEKARRLQWLLQQMIQDTLQENNKELCRDIKECVIKELDYQFRIQEEKEEERDRIREERDEIHYQKLDELLRRKSRRLPADRGKAERSGSRRGRREEKESEEGKDLGSAKLEGKDIQEGKEAKEFQEAMEGKEVQELEGAIEGGKILEGKIQEGKTQEETEPGEEKKTWFGKRAVIKGKWLWKKVN